MVVSFYPSSIINFDICPQHLDADVFKQLLITTLQDRVAYKKRKKESVIFAALEYGLKISLNSIFGLFGYANFLLCDLLCTYKVTVNNQLFLIQLMEMIHDADFEILSANTDGILLQIRRSNIDVVRKIFSEWEEKTGFKLEETEYDLFVRRDVNNYLARKTNGELKLKGDFIPSGAYLKTCYKLDMPFDSSTGCFVPIKGLLKGFEYPVVAFALIAYFIDGVSPEQTILEHRDIFDFCFTQKSAKKYTNFLFNIRRTIQTHNDRGHEFTTPRNIDEIVSKTPLQRTLRFFVSRPSINDDGVMEGGVIKKCVDELKTVQVVVEPKQIIAAEWHEERRINPATGKMKKFREKVRDRQVIPAVLEHREMMVTSETVFASGNFVTLLNNFIEKPWEEYNIDYDFYINATQSIIDKIERT